MFYVITRKLPQIIEEWNKDVDVVSEDASIESDGEELTRSGSDAAMDLSIHNLSIGEDGVVDADGKHKRSDSTSSWASLSLGFF